MAHSADLGDRRRSVWILRTDHFLYRHLLPARSARAPHRSSFKLRRYGHHTTIGSGVFANFKTPRRISTIPSVEPGCVEEPDRPAPLAFDRLLLWVHPSYVINLCRDFMGEVDGTVLEGGAAG